MITRNKKIAVRLLLNVIPEDYAEINYSSETDLIIVSFFTPQVKIKELFSIHRNCSNEEAMEKYREIIEYIEKERGNPVQEIDFRQELMAEMEQIAEQEEEQHVGKD